MNATECTANGETGHQHTVQEILRVLTVIQESETRNAGLHAKLLFLEKKLASNTLHLAVLGQMKRGKSSFINALLGAEILPAGVLPVTAIITEIRYGASPDAVILYTNGQRESVQMSSLAAYVTEAGNPGNKKQVASVEIAYPSPFLESGMILIDTPGIGSTHAHNTRTTERYLDRVDAGIVVLSVDPPITEIESQFLQGLKEEVPKLFFILNKIDVASDEEVSHISRFLEGELSRLRIESPEIFRLSARWALAGRREETFREKPSGIETFERRLQIFLTEEKGQVLVKSVALDALQIARTLKFAAAIGARAQALSPEDLVHRKVALDLLVKQTDAEMHELKVLIRQHSADIVAGVEHDLKAHVQDCVPQLRRELKVFGEDHPGETGRAFGTLLEAFLMQQVEATFRNWRVREDDTVQAHLDLISARLVAKANQVLERLQQTAGALFEISFEPVSVTCPLRVDSRLYYRVERVFHSLDSFLLALPRVLLRPIVLRKANRGVWPLLDMNAGRIRFDYIERIHTTMAEFENSLTTSVSMVTESLTTALDRPSQPEKPATAVVDQLDSLTKTCAQLLL
ncbi:MAG TPA: dynamin family protein [Acidobacteriaceae bacterium]|nr:dynamin family protein [Acidobacteriaceae bacterium]